ncbi:MAG: hypothetical protein KJ935_07170 [Candidatus Omnitrophica bacterium]|nr:hypothetical protein [Candidatus Omnitrophota bacterium]
MKFIIGKKGKDLILTNGAPKKGKGGKLKMLKSDLILVKDLLNGGFYYNNLHKMEKCCRQETDPSRLVSAYVLGCIFFDLAQVVEANPEKGEIKRLEAKYKHIIGSLLEKISSGASLEDQFKDLTSLIQTNWQIGY